MNWKSFPIMDMLDVLIAAVKDKATEDSMEKVREAAQNVVRADAQARRERSCAIVREIAKMDVSMRVIQRQISYWKDLTPEATQSVKRFLSSIQSTINELREQKKRIDRGGRCSG